MLHSCYLIDMNRWKSGRIQFWPRINAYDEQLRWWPKDDIIYFSGMARLMDIDLHVDNTVWWGWMPYPVQRNEVPQHHTNKNHSVQNKNCQFDTTGYGLKSKQTDKMRNLTLFQPLYVE